MFDGLRAAGGPGGLGALILDLREAIILPYGGLGAFIFDPGGHSSCPMGAWGHSLRCPLRAWGHSSSTLGGIFLALWGLGGIHLRPLWALFLPYGTHIMLSVVLYSFFFLELSDKYLLMLLHQPYFFFLTKHLNLLLLRLF